MLALDSLADVGIHKISSVLYRTFSPFCPEAVEITAFFAVYAASLH
jgi:hypothetical protein